MFERIADDVFDEAIKAASLNAFLSDPRHHIVLALDGEVIVGFVSAVHYVHPDKPPELWINELGVAPAFRRQGIATALMERMFAHGRTLGCEEGWVLSDHGDDRADCFYRSLARDGDRRDRAVMHSFRLARD